jgi:hypothetical protein
MYYMLPHSSIVLIMYDVVVKKIIFFIVICIKKNYQVCRLFSVYLFWRVVLWFFC